MQKPGDTKFYKKLKKPPFQPPAWLFAPVWTIIYFLLFASLIFLFKAPPHHLKPLAYVLFSIQLILNLSWMPVFFKKKKICAAFAISILLFLCVLAMIIVFYQISFYASILLIPYLFWSVYASAINFYICEMN